MIIGANTLTVLAGCALFGALAGAVGTFVLARRRALVADVAGHATLPGVCLAFLAGEAWGIGGRTPWLLLLGGAVTALIAACCVPALARLRRVGSDGATAVSLAFFFGLGAVLISVVQSHESGAQGGLRKLLFGSAAAMNSDDVTTLIVLTLATLIALSVFFKEFALLSFDEPYARVAGLPVRNLDLVLTVLLVATVVAGLQVAGIVLVVAMVLTPAAAARQLRGSLTRVTVMASIIGAASAAGGVIVSSMFERVPTGSAMTLVATLVLLIAMALPLRTRLAVGA